MDFKIKPNWLPQVSAPYTYVLRKLKDENVNYRKIKLPAKEFKPLQGLVSLDKISDITQDKIMPSWCSNDMDILDGHHRYGKALAHELPFSAIQIMLPSMDAARILNKIQDIWEYENQIKMEEVVAQDVLNSANEPDSGVSTSEFLASLESEMFDDKEILRDENAEVVNTKKKKIKGYRKKPINEKSKVGNFFKLKPEEGYNTYEIEFDNLLDTNDMDINYHKQNPISILCKYWFPNIDFEKISKKYDVSPESIMNRAISEKARQFGYDGIKYGDIMIQGFK